MADESNLVTCYNKGCGQKFDPNNNPDDACRHHPGVPFFHDAYKGWTCCNKKSVDFTEFLNYPGCAVGKHSNVKPEEPEKPKQSLPDEVIEVKPISEPKMIRPPFESPMTTMKPTLAPSAKPLLNLSENCTTEAESENDGTVSIGTACKNNGCKITYEGESTNATTCVHHPGCPIFHEGMKYWSCCQRKTSDFQTFLNQEGCTRGTHLWHKIENKENVECRWDWHQTGNNIVISIYSKEYCPNKSIIKLSPVRVNVELVFPKQNNATFNLDIETRGIIDVDNSKITMYGTKVELNLKKAQLISWDKLDIPRKKVENVSQKEDSSCKVDKVTPIVDALDLDDLERA